MFKSAAECLQARLKRHIPPDNISIHPSELTSVFPLLNALWKPFIHIPRWAVKKHVFFFSPPSPAAPIYSPYRRFNKAFNNLCRQRDFSHLMAAVAGAAPPCSSEVIDNVSCYRNQG